MTTGAEAMRISILLILTLCAFVGKGEEKKPKDSFVIDYAHKVGEVLYHGTISKIDGQLKASWTYGADGKKKTEQKKITIKTFDSLWNGQNTIDDFKKNRLVKLNSKIDHINNHIISVAYSFKNEQGLLVYSIPKKNVSAKFKEWLKNLAVPVKK